MTGGPNYTDLRMTRRRRGLEMARRPNGGGRLGGRLEDGGGWGILGAVRTRVFRYIFVSVAVLVLMVVAGLSGVLYDFQLRHTRAIDDQTHALQAIQATGAAQAVVDQQRVLLASSRAEPMDRETMQANSVVFQRLVTEPEVASSPGAQQLVQQVVSQYRGFVDAALALPPHPTLTQVLAVQARANAVAELLDELRTGRHTDLRAIIRTEREQRQLAALLLLWANGTILVLVGAGFAFLDRLSKEQARRRVLEATDQLRNELVAFAAHELRNPAAMINAGIYLLRLREVEAEVREKALDSMAQSSAALSRLVMNLLNMGRIEEGRLHLHRASMPLPTLVGDLVEELSAYREQTGNRLQVDLPAVTVDVDPDYARLAISNVLDNAAKYSPPEAPIEITGAVEDSMVVVRIRDHGPGIAPERLAQVFEKYETTEMAPGATHRGTGLGLYMARLLVEAHGGRIWAESEAEAGTTVSFTLPLAATPYRVPTPDPSSRGTRAA